MTRQAIPQIETVKAQDSVELRSHATIGLTILFHPDTRRIGEVAALGTLGSGERRIVSRMEPAFGAPQSTPGDALGTAFLSRDGKKSLWVEIPREGGARIGSGREEVLLDGRALRVPCAVGQRELSAGVVLMLEQTVVLLLHTLDLGREPADDDLGMIGQSPLIRRVRRDVLRVADLDLSVLVRGETGVGKELVASAIHRRGKRATQPYFSVNMAALRPETARSELFGHRRGSFTDATDDHDGYFVRADRGSLFLDEVGDSPPTVQMDLLRVVMEAPRMGIPILGARKLRDVDVRLIAASDLDFEQAASDGGFRSQLLHRLSGYQILVPPLRARREDIGRLFIHYLRGALERTDELRRLAEPAPHERPWLRASFMERLVRHDWPGNVRQLRNVASQLAISNRGERRFRVDEVVDRALRDANPPEPAWDEVRSSHGSAGSRLMPDKAAVEYALKRHDYDLGRTRAELGVSKTWLNAFLGQNGMRGKDRSAAEITRCLAECGGDYAVAARRLGISKRALKQQGKRLESHGRG